MQYSLRLNEFVFQFIQSTGKQNVHYITIVKKDANAVSGWMKCMEKFTVLNGLWLA